MAKEKELLDSGVEIDLGSPILDGIEFPQYIQEKDRTIRVVGEINTKKKELTAIDPTTGEDVPFYDRKGYVDENGYVWIYRSDPVMRNRNLYPYFWVDEKGRKTFSNPNPQVRRRYSYRYFHDLSMERIEKISDVNKVYYDEAQARDISSSGNLFRPMDSEKDDFLTKVVKRVAQIKHVTIEKLKAKATKNHAVMNMKSALEGKTKMSVYYFNQWAQLMGFSYSVIVWDDGSDPYDPLIEPLIYRSWAGERVMTFPEIVEELKEGGGLMSQREKDRTTLLQFVREDGILNSYIKPLQATGLDTGKEEEEEDED